MSRRRSRRCETAVTTPTVTDVIGKNVSEATRRNLHKSLWSLPAEEVAALAESIAGDFIDELDPTSRQRIDNVIEARLKTLLGPAAGRWAKKTLEEFRGGQP